MRFTNQSGQKVIPSNKNTRSYSFTPQSVWHISYHEGLDEFKELIDDQYYKPGLREKGKGAAGVGRKKKLSEFSPLLAQRIIEYWSSEGDLMLDPFTGRGTRVLTAKTLDRRSIGLDISWEFITHVNEKVSKKNSMLDFDESREQFIPSVVRANSMEMPIKDDSVDFIFSCPPFWSIEEYEHHKHQLADIDDYKVFLEKLRDVFKECFRVLKNGKFVVMVVQDFRLWGKFYPFSSHTLNMLEDAGFAIYDNVIRTYTTNIAVKTPDAKAKKYTVKMHENVIVARKDLNAPPVWDLVNCS